MFFEQNLYIFKELNGFYFSFWGKNAFLFTIEYESTDRVLSFEILDIFENLDIFKILDIFEI